MEMATVIKCSVHDCVYNMDNQCHTMAITIGDGNSPRCDTFWHSTMKGGNASNMAGVGACKVSVCKYNKKFECAARGITVNYRDQEPDCTTFETE
jgi:hypothetical protein